MYEITHNQKSPHTIVLANTSLAIPPHLRIGTPAGRSERYGDWLYQRFSSDLQTIKQLVEINEYGKHHGQLNLHAAKGPDTTAAEGVKDFLVSNQDALNQLATMFGYTKETQDAIS